MINETQISHMLHALGIEYERKSGKLLVPGRRCRPLPIAYRNYYQTSFDKEWQGLIDMDMAWEDNAIGQHYYMVTQKGIDYLKEIGYLFKEEKL